MKLIECPLQKNAIELNDHPAIIYGTEIISYAHLNSMVSLTAERLRNLDIKLKDRIGILSPHSIEYVVVLCALWRIGAVACLLNRRYPQETINRQLQEIRCSLLLTSINEIVESKEIFIEKRKLNDIVGQVSGNQEAIQYGDVSYPSEQEATIIFTSGSSHKPKAALHTFGNHYYSAKGSNEHIHFELEDRWLLSLPLYHVGGLGILLRVFLGKGAVVLYDPQAEMAQVIKNQSATHISLVTTQLYRLFQKDENIPILKNVKAILLGGSAIPGSFLRKALHAGLPVYVTYGLTETASSVAITMKGELDLQKNKARVLKYRKARISDDSEICVRGETLFKGYVEGGSLNPALNKDGWFQTGDLGYLSDAGFLTVTGRKDNMFVSGGENIQPEEIEAYLEQIEEVERAVVVPVEDEEFGFRPVAFIKKKSDSQLSKNILMDILQKHLPKFKCPEQFYLWPSQMEENDLKVNRRYFAQLAKEKNRECLSIS